MKTARFALASDSIRPMALFLGVGLAMAAGCWTDPELATTDPIYARPPLDAALDGYPGPIVYLDCGTGANLLHCPELPPPNPSLLPKGFPVLSRAKSCCTVASHCGYLSGGICTEFPEHVPMCDFSLMGISLPGCCASDGNCGVNAAALVGLPGCQQHSLIAGALGDSGMASPPIPCAASDAGATTSGG
jgi:hypothetical protein